jgi:D,D-heptose 1,7-bisphosphate phosphatase
MQVVILCGGKGKRLLPLTKTIPKPMVLVNKKPFLLHLMNYFKKNNFKNFLLLLGYKHKVITDYFGNGKKFNLNIKYNIQSENTNTSKRIFEAKHQLNEKFIIVYSDNFIVFDIKRYVNFFIMSKKSISFLLKRKKNGNFLISKKDSLIYFHNINNNNQYAELGFILSKKKFIFEYINSANINLNDNFKNFLDSKNYTFKVVKENYYSVGDIRRLFKTRRYIKAKKIILIDRDGIINEKPKKGKYITNWNEFKFINNNLEMLTSLSEIGFSFIIISNQAGLNRNMITDKNFEIINNKLKIFFQRKKINLLASYYCPHHWNENCECRKPKNGLLLKASADFNFRLDEVIFIGDQFTDYEAANNSNSYSIIINKKNIFKKKFYRNLLLKTTSINKVTKMINNFYTKNNV